jgi:hypothetical protein
MNVLHMGTGQGNQGDGDKGSETGKSKPLVKMATGHRPEKEVSVSTGMLIAVVGMKPPTTNHTRGSDTLPIFPGVSRTHPGTAPSSWHFHPLPT